MKDQAILFDYILHLADNQLILGQRLSELCGHGPELEQDIAITNIALDLIGQAQLLYDYAGQLDELGRDQDQLAFLRDAHEFRNVQLVEQPNRDFAHVIVRQYLFDEYMFRIYQALTDGLDERLAQIARKAIIEVKYHLRFSRNWMLRLGDGTDISNQKMQAALDRFWPFTGELFQPGITEDILTKAGVAPELKDLEPQWLEAVTATLKEANLHVPDRPRQRSGTGSGKAGIHTEHLGHLLTEMQFLQRAYPGLKW